MRKMTPRGTTARTTARRGGAPGRGALWAAASVVGVLLAGQGTPATADAGAGLRSDVWEVADNVTSQGSFGYEYAEPTASGDVLFAAEEKPLRCWDGTGFRSIAAPPIPETRGRGIASVGGVSCTDVTVFDRQDTPYRWHWDGTSWSGAPAGTRYSVDTLRAFADDDIWGFVSITGEAVHFDGTAWETVAMPPLETEMVVGTSGDDFWALGDDPDSFNTLAYHWNGSRWTAAAIPGGWDGFVFQGAAVSPDELYVFGTSTTDGYLRWDGTAWRHEDTGVTGEYVHGVTYADGTLWVGVYDEFLRLRDGVWQRAALPEVDNPYGMSVYDLATDPRTDTVLAGGYIGFAEGARTPVVIANHPAG